MKEITKSKKNKSIWRTVAKVLLYALLGLFLLFLLLLFGANHYLKNNKEKLINDLEILQDKRIKFEDATISIWSDFPDGSVVLSKVKIIDTVCHHTPKEIIGLSELRLQFDLTNWRSKDLSLTGITGHDGHIDISRECIDHFKNIGANRNNKLEYTVDANNFDLSLQEVDFSFTDPNRTTTISGSAKEWKSKIQVSEHVIHTENKMHLFMNELTFKEENGSFVSNRELVGEFKVTTHEGQLSIDPFTLHVDNHEFETIVKHSADSKVWQLQFDNKGIEFQEAKSLLSNKIQEDLATYHIGQEVITTSIVNIKPKEKTLVTIDYKLLENDVEIDGMRFPKTKMEGQYRNWKIDEDGNRRRKKGEGFFSFKELNSSYSEFSFHTAEMEVGIENDNINVDSKVHISGDASMISDYLNNEKFIFDKGKFTLTADVKSPIKDLKQMITSSSIQLEMEDLNVIYAPTYVVFPFDKLSFEKDAGQANFRILSPSFSENSFYTLEGSLSDIAGLLYADAKNQAQSTVKLYANKISWDDFLDLFGKSGKLKEMDYQWKKQRTMKETTMGIYESFDPTINATIDAIQYEDLSFRNFSSDIHFKDAQNLILDKAFFQIYGGSVNINSTVDISNPKETTFEVNVETKNINLEKILPQLDYFNIELLQNLENLPSNLSISAWLVGTFNDETGLLPNSTFGKIEFESESESDYKGRIVFAPGKSNNETEGNIPPMATSIFLSGNPKVFNEFFSNEEFFFDKGKFNVEFHYEGHVNSIDELLNFADVSIEIDSSEIYYKSLDLTVPLTRIDASMKDDICFFDIHMRAASYKQQIDLKGEVENVSELIIGNTNKPFSTKLNVSSPRLVWKDFYSAFTKEKDETTDKQMKTTFINDLDNDKDKTIVTNTTIKDNNTEDKKRLNKFSTYDSGAIDDQVKDFTRTILEDFDPEITVRIDTFEFSDKLHLHNLKTGLTLIDTTVIYLEETGFDFHDGYMSMTGQIDISDNDESPIVANFKTEDLDFVRLLQSVDYLGIESLQNTKKLTGRINMDVSLNTTLSADGNKFLTEKTNAFLDFTLYHVEVEGLDIIDSISSKIRMKQKFKLLKFAPISNVLTIVGSEIRIPQMEIQSNAMNLFAQGTVDPTNATNVWLSLPLDNINPKDLDRVPSKRGYAQSGPKLYLELTDNPRAKSKMKLHLRKKKFYEQRGIEDQYKSDRKRDRKIWRAVKKKKRGGWFW